MFLGKLRCNSGEPVPPDVAQFFSDLIAPACSFFLRARASICDLAQQPFKRAQFEPIAPDAEGHD